MGLVKRSDRLAFLGVEDGEDTTFHRMVNFTEMRTDKNPLEYRRRYVDEEFERVDVVGYATGISYAFDLDSDSPVHSRLAEIADSELTGEDTVCDIVTVNLAAEDESGVPAVKRSFCVIPEREGDDAESYTYSGTFKVCGERTPGLAATTDDWKTLTFTAEGSESENTDLEGD